MIHAIATELADARDAQSYWDVCHRQFEQYGVMSICYGYIPFGRYIGSGKVTRSGFYKSTHSDEWLSAVGNESALDNDISIDLLLRQPSVIYWHDESVLEHANEDQRRVFELEHDLGMVTGVTLSVAHFQTDNVLTGVGLNTPQISQREFDKFWLAASVPLQQLCTVLDYGMRYQYPDGLVHLSPRERDVLSYLAVGYRPHDIALRLKRSRKTLEKYIDSAKMKLKANSRDNAVAKALVMGLIKP